MKNKVLNIFHPLISEWFTSGVGSPTDIQEKAWPAISEGRHLLITAPTGSGKTLCAFLYALNQLITGSWESGKTRVLYISPLKALNNDIRKNLLAPLSSLRELFQKKGIDFPVIKVLTRSGDTTASERRRMLSKPPEILITTPESLNIMLTGKKSRDIFTGIKTVILDEIHAIAATKRGTHLITAVDRLVPLCGEFQRISLSATVRPLKDIADFTAGYVMSGKGPDCHYEKRQVEILTSSIDKQYAVSVETPDDELLVISEGGQGGDDRWSVVADYIRDIINKNNSTLVFVNSRQFCEKMTRLLNGDSPVPLAYAHHGSLSKEIRLAVEDKLKKGELKAIVATNSLELGIDVGELDKVVLLQTPFSLSGAIQRVGRAGHTVNEISSGVLVPTFEKDFISAAVAAGAIVRQEIEEVKPVDSPLDILTQIILAMTAVQEWNSGELYAFLKTSWPYRNLSRKNFELVLEMLSGKYSDTRIKELKPRIYHDAVTDTVRARENALFLLYSAGGTIPDRGYYNLRAADSKAKIGELDEEFVWERHIGDVFTLGTQVWQIKQITQNDVLVGPSDKALNILPFWKADDRNRNFYFSEKLGNFLEEINDRLDDKKYLERLQGEYFFSAGAVEKLTGFLKRQKMNTDSALPSRHHVVMEYYDDPLKTSDYSQIIIHTMWGGALNRPFVYALAAAWEEKYDVPLQFFVNNDAILLIYPHTDEQLNVFDLINSTNMEKYLRKKLEATAYFAAKFRKNAGRALLLPSGSFRNRVPLWLTRIRSRKIMDEVYGFSDFPILLETWRECLEDDFDLENLAVILDEIERSETTVTRAKTITISPFASDMVWLHTNQYMYTYDIAEQKRHSNLSDQLIGDILHSSSLRPRIPDEVITLLDAKLKREYPGYAPSSAEDLLSVLQDRLIVRADEWQLLCTAVTRDNGLDSDGLEQMLDEIMDKAIKTTLPGADEEIICVVENVPRIAASLGIEQEKLAAVHVDGSVPGKGLKTNLKIIREKLADHQYDRDDFFLQWLGYYAIADSSIVSSIFGTSLKQTGPYLDSLAENDSLIIDTFREDGDKVEICKTENLEILLRMARVFRQPGFDTLDICFLPLFLAEYQGLTGKRNSIDDLKDVIDMLFGYPLYSELWEQAVLPARFGEYKQIWLESLFQSSRLLWFGAGKTKAAFSFSEDLELFLDSFNDEEKNRAAALFPTARGKYSFFDLKDFSGRQSGELTEQIWQNVWDGIISCDNITTLRKGIMNKFRTSSGSDQTAGRRRGFARWQAERPLEGNWFVLDRDFNPDPVESLELEKFRIRQLFSRYGILFRELLANELPLLQWRNVFRTLRLMELSGEILSGRFFGGIHGLQFITPEALQFLKNGLNEQAVYWLNAADPASVCGIKLEGLKAGLPYRLASNWIVYRGCSPVLTAAKNCRELKIDFSADDEKAGEYFSFFKSILSRQFNPPNKLVIESINDKPAEKSEYSGILKEMGFKTVFGKLELWRM